jgi:hypothetical protein
MEILDIVKSIAAIRAKHGRQVCSSSACSGDRRRHQRLRKKTEAILEVIIMVCLS